MIGIDTRIVDGNDRNGCGLSGQALRSSYQYRRCFTALIAIGIRDLEGDKGAAFCQPGSDCRTDLIQHTVQVSIPTGGEGCRAASDRADESLVGPSSKAIRTTGPHRRARIGRNSGSDHRANIVRNGGEFFSRSFPSAGDGVRDRGILLGNRHTVPMSGDARTAGIINAQIEIIDCKAPLDMNVNIGSVWRNIKWELYNARCTSAQHTRSGGSFGLIQQHDWLRWGNTNLNRVAGGRSGGVCDGEADIINTGRDTIADQLRGWGVRTLQGTHRAGPGESVRLFASKTRA